MKHCLYRHWDKHLNLLYIGESLGVLRRTHDHLKNSSWFETVAFISLEWFATKKAAKVAEAKAIRIEKPIHNKHHSKPTAAEIAKSRTLGPHMSLEALRDAHAKFKVDGNSEGASQAEFWIWNKTGKLLHDI